MSWADEAACRHTDPELFFPHMNTASTPIEAKAVCARCPVRQPCLKFALEMESGYQRGRYGVWGGLTPDERAALTRKQTDAVCHG